MTARMKRNWAAAAVVAVAYAGQGVFSQKAPATPGPVTAAQYERWKTELSNWGRWGKDDQIGTLNLITPEKRRQAAALVRDGVSVSLAGDADTEKAVDNPTPYEFTMLGLGTDRIGVAYHGIAHTHLDAWNHISANGVFYNGYKPDPDAVAKAGHQRNSILNVKNGIFTRGILIDIPRLKGVPYLEPGTPIYRRRPRGVGKAGRRPRVAGRRALRPDGRVGAPQGDGAVAARARRGRPIGRPGSFGHPLAAGAGRGGDGQRPPPVRLTGSGGSATRRHPRLRPRLSGAAPLRQL